MDTNLKPQAKFFPLRKPLTLTFKASAPPDSGQEAPAQDGPAPVMNDEQASQLLSIYPPVD